MRLEFAVRNDEALRVLRNAPKKFITRGRIVMGRNAGIIQRRVEATAPRDTHFMATHVRIERYNDGLAFEVGWWAAEFIAESESHQFYPPHVEYGTGWTRAQPSLGPAYRKQVPVIVRGVSRIMVDIAREG